MTRTTFQDDNMVTHVRWNANDGILVSSGKQKNVLYRALESQNGTTEFVPEREELSVSEGKMVYATYPFADLYYDNSLPDSIIEVRRREPLIDKNNACQDVLYAANKVENGKINLQFKHLFTFIKVILPKKSLGNTTWVQLRSNATIDYDEMLFDIKNERIVGGRPLNFTIYNIDISGAESDDMNVYLYFAILPQPENVAITLWNCDYRDNSEKFFFSRKTPTGGMKAGCM